MQTLTWKFAQSVGSDRPPPTLVLETLEQTLAYLNAPEVPGLDRWRVCSIPLMDFMDELEKDGYVYNLQALRAFEKAHGLPESPENGSTLSRLVYTCQGYRRARRLELDGWEIVTPELLQRAMTEGKRVHVKGESMLGNQVQEAFAVRVWKYDGMPWPFRPRKKMPLNLAGMPAKLVA